MSSQAYVHKELGSVSSRASPSHHSIIDKRRMLNEKRMKFDSVHTKYEELYQINTQRIQNKERLRAKQLEGLETFPFKPEINEKSKKLARDLSPVHERLRDWGSRIWDRKEQISIYHKQEEERELRNFPFKPSLSPSRYESASSKVKEVIKGNLLSPYGSVGTTPRTILNSQAKNELFSTEAQSGIEKFQLLLRSAL